MSEKINAGELREGDELRFGDELLEVQTAAVICDTVFVTFVDCTFPRAMLLKPDDPVFISSDLITVARLNTAPSPQ